MPGQAEVNCIDAKDVVLATAAELSTLNELEMVLIGGGGGDVVFA